MKIALLRHGPTEWNVLGRIQGHTDIPLSDAGLAKIRGLMPPPGFEPDSNPGSNKVRVFASPLTRTRQTAEALGLKAPVFDARLKEQHWGHWEGLDSKGILARDGADAYAKAGVKLDFRPPGGESTGELHSRVAAFFKEVAQQPGDAIVVTHLGVLRAAYTLATNWAMDRPMPPDLDLACALILSLDESGVPSLHALNVALPPRL